MGDCLRKKCRSILSKDCPTKGNLDIFGKTILIFSAILAKRGNLNLDLNLDLHGYKIILRTSYIFLAVLVLSTAVIFGFMYARTYLLYYTTRVLLDTKMQ